MLSINTRTLVGLAATAILGGTSIAVPLAVSADGADSAQHTSVRGMDDPGHRDQSAHGQAAVRDSPHHESGDDHGRDRVRQHEAGDDHGSRHGSRHG